jgi:predicted ATPase
MAGMTRRIAASACRGPAPAPDRSPNEPPDRTQAEMLQTLAVQNYRTLRDFVIPLGQLNVITGANGSGKSNMYKALRVLAETAQGGVVASIAREGGLGSTLWAGPENPSRAMRAGEFPIQGTVRQHPVSVQLGFAASEVSYAIDLGLPTPSASAFGRDPVIKGEYVWAGPVARPAAMLVERHGAVVRSRDAAGKWQVVHDRMSLFDSMLSQLADPARMPELLALREQIRSWRFYDHFRTDAQAPARLPQVGTYTPVLGHEGAELAAALQTIREAGDHEALAATIDDAFPGASVTVDAADGHFEVRMHQQGLLRPLRAVELSDGTLRYLLWAAALLSPRPPALLVLNEPETSLHPDLLPALGRLIARASRDSQVFVVSHARRLIAALEEEGAATIALVKELGETSVADLDRLDRPAWRWVGRG